MPLFIRFLHGSEKLTQFLMESVSLDMLQESSDKQVELSSSVNGLQTQLTKALLSEIMDLQNLHRLEGKEIFPSSRLLCINTNTDSMADSETNLDTFLVGTTSDLALHFIQSHRHIRDGLETIGLLKGAVSL